MLPGTFQYNAIHDGQPITKSNPVFLFFKKKLIYHTVFWIVYFLFIYAAFYTAYDIRDIKFYIQISTFMPFSAVLVYTNIYVLIAAFLYNRKYIWYGITLILSILTMAIADQLLKKMYVHFGFSIFSYTSGLGFKSLFSESGGLFYLAGFTTGVKVPKD